jgi:DNA-binding CsgD family transcriptional regulator
MGLHALAVLDLGLGRYQSALDHALAVFREDPPAVGNLVLPLIVEAGVRADRQEAAAAALARMAERAPAAGTPWGLGLLARCRALMASDEDAEAWYRESIELLSQVPVALYLAHTRLLFGEWLRRRKRRGEARTYLRAAHQLFDSCGAVPFAERARAELLACGEQVRKRALPPRNDDLTPQERHVAVLAAGGNTNAEIASRLFITVSTVEFHLNKVFRKLGISSRRQIKARMGAASSLFGGLLLRVGREAAGHLLHESPHVPAHHQAHAEAGPVTAVPVDGRPARGGGGKFDGRSIVP